MKAKKVTKLAGNVKNLLSGGRIGHLSTISPQERISIVPIGYFFDGLDIYFGTPRTSAKLKFMQKNPNVSFTIDNGKVMREALGVLIHNPYTPCL
ncbi:MAG: pyridoxamine 5'-phosphate oxidase family protein [Candidatus Hydrothermarchaeales archaeon]